jgi:hypothetical protein
MEFGRASIDPSPLISDTTFFQPNFDQLATQFAF